MKNIFASLVLWKKFALLGVIGLILFGVPTALYLSSTEQIIAHKKLEMAGVNPARLLLRTVQMMQQHRGMSAVMLGGDAGVASAREGKAADVDKALQALRQALQQIHVRDPKILSQLDVQQADWSKLRDAIGARQLAPPQSFATHSGIIAHLFELNDLLLDEFMLSLDPDFDSSQLIEGAFVALPQLTEELGKSRARGAAALLKKDITQNERVEIIALLQRAQERLSQTNKAFRKAFQFNAPLKDRLGAAVGNADQLSQGVIRLANEQIIQAQDLSYSSPDYFKAFTVAIDEQFKLVDQVIAALDGQLGAQTASLRRQQLTVLGSILLLALLAAWVGTMLTRSITLPMSESVQMAQRVAACDLTSRAEVVGKDESAQLLHALNGMTGSLVHIVGDVRSSIDVIHVASQEIATGNSDLSSRTESQASSLEQTASSMEQLTSTVKQNAENANEANQLANSAAQLAVRGGEVVGSVVQTMGSIKASSGKIVDIISVIDGIAFQTNILALNAAVEAARAGEQGRGFAVVASEVRSLAQRSASAAKEIKELISDSVGKVDAGGKLVDEAGATMEEIVTSVKHVAHIMSEITVASQEQSAGIGQVNDAITQMEAITQQNAALVEQAAAAAESLQEQADLLARTVSVFKIQAGSSGPSGFGEFSAAVPVAPVSAATSPATRAAALPKQAVPVKKEARSPARANGPDDWEEF
ncbi:methyl-accepting chemotaxis protein [Herbaspirillum lusitanum]|uniref:Methyl-accepting chemotaxis protein n=1 Tax=Herbaspirillum lusitanum TaxID=213312 RepID=A0ABW9ADF7_9BURK